MAVRGEETDCFLMLNQSTTTLYLYTKQLATERQEIVVSLVQLSAYFVELR